jgi:ParB/RepB/Spo0J family partition protein
MTREIQQVDVDAIDIGADRRVVMPQDVERLVASIERIGLQTPITIRYCPERPSHDGCIDSYLLLTGAHRLAAVRQLGWDKIECFIMNCDQIEAELIEIAENLHRCELTALERSNQIARWAELTATKVRQVDEPLAGGRQPSEKGQAKVARALGISEPDARRAVKVASLSPEAKMAARAAGIDNNRSALLKAAAAATPAAQVQTISEIALARVKTPEGGKASPATSDEIIERCCGAIRKAVFDALGGLKSEQYAKLFASIQTHVKELSKQAKKRQATAMRNGVRV